MEPNEPVKRLFYATPKEQVFTHFELGRRIHIRDYFYAKEYFQHSDKYLIQSKKLAEQILKLEPLLPNTTFLSCGSFSGPFMNDVVERIRNNRAGIATNYGIVDNINDKISFYLKPDIFHENIVIVLPITCTYNSALNVEKLVEQHAKENNLNVQINVNVFCVFLICDEELQKVENKFHGFNNGDQISQRVNSFYLSFDWQFWNMGVVTFLQSDVDGVFYGHCIEKIYSELYLPEKCLKCYPAAEDGVDEQEQLLNEICLLPTRRTNDTPNLIYGLPRFSNYDGNLGPISTKDNLHSGDQIVLSPGKSSPSFTDDPAKPEHPSNDVFNVDFNGSHIYGHLEFEKNSYLHYIKRDVFYEKNKKEIKRFFHLETNDLWKNWKPEDRLLIVTVKHNTSSSFLTDFIQTPTLKDKLVTVLMVDPFGEYLENLSVEYNEYRNYSKVLFFDYVISGARIFKSILDRLNLITNGGGFDRLLFVIDRTTEDSKAEILSTATHGRKDYFVAYCKLNVPLMSATKSGNPITEKMDALNEIFKECHLDALKLSIGADINYGAPKSFSKLDEFYRKEISDDEKIRYLVKLQISHLISDYFLLKYKGDEPTKSKVPAFSVENLEEMIREIQGYKKQFFASSTSTDVGKADPDTVIDDIIIKTLSRQPFKIYHGVYQTVFRYAIGKMDKIVTEITNSPSEVEKKRFKFYLKRCVELNSNYIISYKFIARLKEIFVYRNNKKNSELLEIKYFILKCFKELIHKNPSRSIKLEYFINHKDVLPDPLLYPADFTLKSAVQNEFYQLGRIIKSENLYLLDELRTTFLQDTKDKTDLPKSDADFISYTIDNYLSGPMRRKEGIFRLITEFLKHSRYSDENSIKPNIAKMLQTAYMIENGDKTGTDVLAGAKAILRSACEIISDNNEDTDRLDYGFFIEYTKAEDLPESGEGEQSYLNNIYSIVSDLDDDVQPKIRKDGFISSMMDGLKNNDRTDADVQTFVVLAKDENDKIISFRDEYYNVENNRKVLPDEILRDYRAENRETDIFNNAKFILLFRLANISIDEEKNTCSNNGQAVFAICYPKAVFQKSGKDEVLALTDFLDVERVRLLLLIKEQLLNYLKKLFKNDVFVTLKSQNEKNQLKRELKHGIENYVKAFKFLVTDKAPPPERQLMIDFLQKTISRHLSTFIEDGNKLSRIHKDVSLDTEELRKTFNLVMKLPGIGYSINNHNLNLDIPKGLTCHPAITEQIIPELIVNMKKYSFDAPFPRNYSITYKNGYLIFRNHYDSEDLEFGKAPQDKKPMGGKAMCDHILNLLNLGKLEDNIEQDFIYAIKFKIHA